MTVPSDSPCVLSYLLARSRVEGISSSLNLDISSLLLSSGAWAVGKGRRGVVTSESSWLRMNEPIGRPGRGYIASSAFGGCQSDSFKIQPRRTPHI